MTEASCTTCGPVTGRVRRGLCDRHYGQWYRDRETGERCAGGGCDRKPVAVGYCNAHYLRIRRNGHLNPVLPVRDGCAVPDCGREHFGLGYCQGHYARLRQHGDVHAGKPLRPFRPGTGYINAKGYQVLSDGRLEHRVVMSDVIGRPLRNDEQVHHRNGVRADNRPQNLELWVISQPAGQRVTDVVEHAVEMLRRYAPDALTAT